MLHASTAASKSQLLEGRQLCREAHCQQDGPCPGDTRCPGRELRHGTAQCWSPTCTALGCINPRTLGQVCHWIGTRTGTDTSTTAPDGGCIPPQHAHKYILPPTDTIYMRKLQFYQYPRLEIFHSCLGEGIADNLPVQQQMMTMAGMHPAYLPLLELPHGSRLGSAPRRQPDAFPFPPRAMSLVSGRICASTLQAWLDEHHRGHPTCTGSHQREQTGLMQGHCQMHQPHPSRRVNLCRQVPKVIDQLSPCLLGTHQANTNDAS